MRGLEFVRVHRGFAPRKAGPWHVVIRTKRTRVTALCGASVYVSGGGGAYAEKKYSEAEVEGKRCPKCFRALVSALSGTDQ